MLEIGVKDEFDIELVSGTPILLLTTLDPVVNGGGASLVEITDELLPDGTPDALTLLEVE